MFDCSLPRRDAEILLGMAEGKREKACSIFVGLPLGHRFDQGDIRKAQEQALLNSKDNTHSPEQQE